MSHSAAGAAVTVAVLVSVGGRGVTVLVSVGGTGVGVGVPERLHARTMNVNRNGRTLSKRLKRDISISF
jgi:hypothetical protein